MATISTIKEQLQAQFASGFNELRPLITSLNGDNTWLWSFPRPPSERDAIGKAYYHIVFEPWLLGSTSTMSPWLVSIKHEFPPAVTTGAEIECVVEQIEECIASVTGKHYHSDLVNDGERSLSIDAILIGFHYLDHLHEPTLRTFKKDIPVIASPEAAQLIKGWAYFDTVTTISDFSSQSKMWRAAAQHPPELPVWLSPLRLPGHHELNYCLALIWTHTKNGNEVHEAIIQTPHGTRLNEGPLQAFLQAEPQCEKLALFHGLKESRSAGKLTTLGAASGLGLYRCLGNPKYWVVSHNSALRFSGLIMWLTNTHDTPRTIDWALEKAQAEDYSKREPMVTMPNLVKVENGRIFRLL